MYYIVNGDYIKRYATSSIRQAAIYFKVVRDLEGFAAVYHDDECIIMQYADWYFED